MIIRGEISEPETMVKFKAYAGKHEETLKLFLAKLPQHASLKWKKKGIFRLRSHQEYNPELLNWIEEKRPQKES